jgi:hypothetical protein
MPRTELLALSLDDLAVLTNRGVVKRAQREIESGEITGTLSEKDDGEVVAQWSDGVECRLPAGKVVGDGRCTCAATDVCRHIVRTVLAYQRQPSATKAAGGEAGVVDGVASPPEPPAVWDPGTIDDSALAVAFRPAALAKARDVFEQGMLVELVRSAKPSARFHVPPHTLRFLVPGDIRYTHCDCAEAAPCRHVPLAVWAFRALAQESSVGLVSTQTTAPAVPIALLDAVDEHLREWLEQGTAGSPRSWTDRLAKLQARCLADDLVWPAEIIDDLSRQFERYLGHDALFDANRVADLMGELLIRCDAIRSNTFAVPQMLIRGSSADRPAEIGSARYVGLGCGATVGRKSVTLEAYLQDVDTGTVVVLERDFANPAADSAEGPRPVWKLAQTTALKGASFAILGAGQLVLQGGKRTPGNQLVVGRGRAVVNPQAFTWEQVRAPVFAEDFEELRARLSLLPPASLRPRRVAEDFHVVPIAGVAAAGFDPASQMVRAILRDARGGVAALEHPFDSRAEEGTNALLEQLTLQPANLRYVAAHARLGPIGLVLAPVALVFQDGASNRRQAIQPWVDRPARAGTPSSDVRPTSSKSAPATRVVDPAEEYPRQLLSSLGELVLLGVGRADAHSAGHWRELARFGEAVGFHRLTRPVSALANALEQKQHTPRWDPTVACRSALEVAVLARLALDLNG